MKFYPGAECNIHGKYVTGFLYFAKFFHKLLRKDFTNTIRKKYPITS